MTTGFSYAVGTLAAWIALAFATRAVFLALKLAFREPGLDLRGAARSAFVSLGVAGVLGFAASVLAPQILVGGGSFKIPLVWLIMPFSGWAALACLFFSVLRAVQAFLGVSPDERASRLRAAGLWALGAAVFGWLLRSSGEGVQVLEGKVELSTMQAASLSLLLVFAMGAMVAAKRFANGTRGISVFASHLALIMGSVVFGLPFLWQLVTSFKEDRDMASPEGLVWVPRVQRTEPYLDPDNPLVETQFRGQTVRGSLVKKAPDGTLTVDIQNPLALRGLTAYARPGEFRIVPKDAAIVSFTLDGAPASGMVVRDLEDGSKVVETREPLASKGTRLTLRPGEFEPVRDVGLRWQNYPEALEFLPPETQKGLVYLKNTLILVVLTVIGTLLSSSLVAYAFARLRFPGKGPLFLLLLSTMMLPAAVTLLPQFLIFRWLGWIDTLLPLWVPAFFASAFNVFLFRQFFLTIPLELEDAAKIDGCSYLKTFWKIMLPQIKPALAVVAIWTFIAAWNNFMGPLVYINSPENMPISYGVQLYQGDRNNEPGLLMAFATMAMLPVLLVFAFLQKYFIEGVTLSGLGGR
jgi:multiple sugar transport system permease protein